MTVEKKPADGPLIHKAMLAIMRDIDAIGKTRDNKQQGFKYRGIDQVYNEVHPLLCKHGVYMAAEVIDKQREDRTTKSGGGLIYTSLTMRYRFIAEDGSTVITEAQGEGMDSGDKSSNKAMAVAHKYAIFQAFCIPTEDMPDPDAESHEVQPKQAPMLPPLTPSEAEAKATALEQSIDRTASLAELADMWNRNGDVLVHLSIHDKTRFDLLTAQKDKRKEHFNTKQKAV